MQQLNPHDVAREIHKEQQVVTKYKDTPPERQIKKTFYLLLLWAEMNQSLII